MVQSQPTSSGYTIGALARAVGVNIESVRYYERRGLISQPERPARSVRRYSDDHLRRLHFIKSAQGAGFSLAEIQALMLLEENRSCRETRVVVAERLQAIETRLRELKCLRSDLRRWLAECDANPEDDDCPALAAIGAGARAEHAADLGA